MLKNLVENVDNIHNHMENFSRDIKTIKKSPKKILEMINIMSEMKNSYDGHISRLETLKESRL